MFPGKPNHLFDSDTTASDVIEAAARYWLGTQSTAQHARYVDTRLHIFEE